MNMYFEGSSNVTLLFNFWDVRGPAGMVLSVFVVLLLTVMYELLKVWKITIGNQKKSPNASPSTAMSFSQNKQSCFATVIKCQEGSGSLANSPSEVSLTPTENTGNTADSSTAAKRRR